MASGDAELEIVICDDRRAPEFFSVCDVSKTERDAIFEELISRMPFDGEDLKNLIHPSSHPNFLFFVSQAPSDLYNWREFVESYSITRVVLWSNEEAERDHKPIIQRVELSGIKCFH